MKRTVLIVLLALVAASPASAAPFDRRAAAQRVAERVWDRPCGGAVTVRVAPLERGLVGFAAFTRPAGGEYRDCGVTLAASEFARGQSSYHYYCTAVLHFYGQLAGAPFSRDERSIMYPVIDVDRRCRR